MVLTPSSWLELELMPFGQAPAGLAMTSSWGGGVVMDGVHDLAPRATMPNFHFFYLFLIISTNKCCPPRSIPKLKNQKMPLHS